MKLDSSREFIFSNCYTLRTFFITKFIDTIEEIKLFNLILQYPVFVVQVWLNCTKEYE